MSGTRSKERSLDESFDALVCRPLGRAVARGLLPTGVTANQVSGLAALFGAAAGAEFAAPWPSPAYGALLLFGMMVLDCADGEIARLRGGGGWRGRVLDGMADLVTAFAIHLGMLLHLNRTGGVLLGFELTPTVNFFLALGAGASMSWRCGVVDDMKQRLKVSSIDREIGAHAAEPRGLIDRFLFWSWKSYVESIALYSGRRRPGGYARFRLSQIVGPTHHHLAMVLAGLSIGFMPQAYLVFFISSLVPANLYLLTVLLRASKRGDSSAGELAAER